MKSGSERVPLIHVFGANFHLVQNQPTNLLTLFIEMGVTSTFNRF